MSYTRGWTLEQIEDLKYMYENGYNQKEVSEAVGKSISSTISKANELNIIYRRTHRYRESDNKYLCLCCRQFKEKWEFYFRNDTGKANSECIDCCRDKKRKSRLEKKLQEADPLKSKEEVNGGPLRLCTYCNEEFPVELFNWERKGEKLKTYCPTCRQKRELKYKLEMIEKRGY